MLPNFLVLGAAAFIPFSFAYLWFHPALFGGERWDRLAELAPSKRGLKVSPTKLVASLVLNFLLAIAIYAITVHQGAVFSIVGGDAEALTQGAAAELLATYTDHLSFGHGMFHGLQVWLCCALPFLGYVYIFEHRRRDYLAVYLTYWLISIVLMSGTINQWGYQWDN